MAGLKLLMAGPMVGYLLVVKRILIVCPVLTLIQF